MTLEEQFTEYFYSLWEFDEDDRDVPSPYGMPWTWNPVPEHWAPAPGESISKCAERWYKSCRPAILNDVKDWYEMRWAQARPGSEEEERMAKKLDYVQELIEEEKRGK